MSELALNGGQPLRTTPFLRVFCESAYFSRLTP